MGQFISYFPTFPNSKKEWQYALIQADVISDRYQYSHNAKITIFDVISVHLKPKNIWVTEKSQKSLEKSRPESTASPFKIAPLLDRQKAYSILDEHRSTHYASETPSGAV